MYELIEIDQAERTRFLLLKNVVTKTVESCFDDSAVVSNKNFNFMQEGELYDCKIELFGIFTKVKERKSVRINLNAPEISIGNETFLSIFSNDDIYYIRVSELEGVVIEETPYYSFSRKDIIQVDDVVHPCFLSHMR